jgi:hypothetical protein
MDALLLAVRQGTSRWDVLLVCCYVQSLYDYDNVRVQVNCTCRLSIRYQLVVRLEVSLLTSRMTLSMHIQLRGQQQRQHDVSVSYTPVLCWARFLKLILVILMVNSQ